MPANFMPWLSEVGLLLDLIGFAMLSIDLVSSLRGERNARDDLIELERGVFNNRYGVFAPSSETLAAQQEEFETKIKARVLQTDASMRGRRTLAYWAIGIASVGFALQIVGGWPS